MGLSADHIGAATRAALLGHHDWGAGTDIREVLIDNSDLLVVVSYARDPLSYAIRWQLPDPTADQPAGPWTGTAVSSAEEWAWEAAGWLQEEFSTGFVRRAGRTASDVGVELSRRPGKALGRLQLRAASPADDQAIRRARLDPAAAQRARADDRLITWLCVEDGSAAHRVGRAHRSSRRATHHSPDASPVARTFVAAESVRLLGQVVVSWESGGPDVARVDMLETVADAPAQVGQILAGHAVHEAAEAGATTVVTTAIHPSLAEVGFHADSSTGPMTLEARHRQPV